MIGKSEEKVLNQDSEFNRFVF